VSLHPSLKGAERLSFSRSVMKRTERIKWLKERGRWDESKGVLGLPKIKVIKLKTVKKEKPKEEEKQEEKQEGA
jgi:small basic protein (TIGR04137 family)